MFVPYLFFHGQCAEAMAYYGSLFGGEVQRIRYADMPPGEGGEDFVGEDIMHAWLELPSGALLWASDSPPGMAAGRAEGMAVATDIDNYAEAKARFDALLEGGELVWPWGPVFWSPGFGMLRDRYGVQWIITALSPPEQ